MLDGLKGLVGRVFISCGQREGERVIAEKIRTLLKSKFSLESYLAFKIQGLDDIMKITEELKSCDYYLFVDFYRKRKFINIFKNTGNLACSLFTHQELALAHHVGFKEIIAIQEKGAPLEGFIKYLLSNPEHFKNEQELLQKVEYLVRNRGWNKDYSRNLVLEEVRKYETVITSNDQAGGHTEFVWHAKIVNRRPDIAAVNVCCVLDSIVYPDGGVHKSSDRSFLKCAGQFQAYSLTILPQEFGLIDIFSIHAEKRGLFLHSVLASSSVPIVQSDGMYKLNYKLFSEGFPLLYFTVEVNYRAESAVSFWENPTEAHF